LGVSTHCTAVMVDDVDRHHEGPVAAGAAAVYPPKHLPYGVPEYAAGDLECALWSFKTPINPEGGVI
jgi:MerR family transcriptional regulator, thiopeptide resistance regulator